MHTHRRTRRAGAVVTVAALALSVFAVPASAHSLKGVPKAEKVQHQQSHRAEREQSKADKKRQQDERKAAKRAERLARFQVTGDVVGIEPETRTLHVAVRGGTKTYRGQTVAVVVGEAARINRDDVAVALDAVQLGDRAAVKGRMTDGTLVAARVNASTPEVEDEHTPVVEEEEAVQP